MSRYIDAARNYFEDPAREGRENPSAHQRKICQNYVEHLALEAIGRWDDVLQPERTIDEPVYRVRFGRGATGVYEDVAAFYSGLFAGGPLVMPITESRFAVADWGISAFVKCNLFLTRAQVLEHGVFDLSEQDLRDVDPSGNYVLEAPLGYFWGYDEDARLTSESVYKTEPTNLIEVAPEDVVTLDDIHRLVAPYLPHTREVGSCDAFR